MSGIFAYALKSSFHLNAMFPTKRENSRCCYKIKMVPKRLDAAFLAPAENIFN